MSFEDLGLAPFLLRALAEQGYETPTAIQREAIPQVLEGHDLLAGAQTGTGKTAAFGLPVLQYLATTPQAVNGPRKPRALILTPTRELATQVHDSLRGYGKYQRIPSAVIYGGVGMGNQLDALRRGIDLLVACPGRLIDHLERRSVDLSGIEVLVLDEADRMLDMGFLPSIKRILAKLPRQNRQTLLFSATFEESIKQLALEFMHNPKQIQVTPQNTVAENLGGTGATIGHEISHSFDDQGAQFDSRGALRNWWTPSDLAHFRASGKALAEQFSQYKPFPDLALNGKLTLGENIGDLSGVEAAYAAYKKYEAKHGESPVIDGLTGDQRFFIAYAQAWQEKQREGAERQQVITNEHSPGKYRVNGVVRNVDAWYKAFNVQPGDKLYLPPDQRVHIW